jgi:hypothetical protein
MNTMAPEQFRTACQAGGLVSVGVTADSGRFFVTAQRLTRHANSDPAKKPVA